MDCGKMNFGNNGYVPQAGGYGIPPSAPPYEPSEQDHFYTMGANGNMAFHPQIFQPLSNIKEKAIDLFNSYYVTNPSQHAAQPVRSSTSSPTEFSFFKNGWYWGGNTHRTEHHYHYASANPRETETDSKKKQTNQGAVILAGMIFATVAIVTSYFLGKDCKRLIKAKQGLKEVNELHTALKHVGQSNELIMVQELQKKANEYFATIKWDATISLSLKVALLADCIAGIAAAILAPELIGAVAMASLVIACLWVFKKGFYSDHHETVNALYTQLINHRTYSDSLYQNSG